MTQAERLRIERLVAGGDGLAREPGRPVTFVAGTAPGDLVEAVVDPARSRPQHRHARLLRVLEPGPGRREAPCPEASACGGCPWMHLTDEAQAAAAADVLASALRRAGAPLAAGALRPAVAAAPALGQRQRMRLHLDLRRAPMAGFLRAASHDVHPAAACLALRPALEDVRRRIVGALPALRDALGPVRAELAVDLPRDDAGAGLLRLRTGMPDGALARALDVLRAAAPVLGALAAQAGDAPRVRLGDDAVAFRRGPVEDPERWPAFLAPGGFLQAGREGSALLVSRVLAAARACGLGPGSRVLELHAGSGHLTLPLAGLGCEVEASDADEEAVELARRAVEACRPRPSIRLVARDAAIHAAEALKAGRRFDAVVLDPPRTGAPSVAPLLAELADVLVWVSCDAPTFARDAAAAGRGGFVVESVEPLLLFPQTSHFESVAVLRRGVRVE